MSVAIFLSEPDPVNSWKMYWILSFHHWFWASCQQPHAADTHWLYIVTPLPNMTKVLFNKNRKKSPFHWVEKNQSQRFNLRACDFTRCKCCTGLQPSSSITAQIFPFPVLNVLGFVNSTMVYFLWGNCFIGSTVMCIKKNSEDVLFEDF